MATRQTWSQGVPQGTSFIRYASEEWPDDRGAIVGRAHVRVPLAPDEQGPAPAERGLRMNGRTVVPTIPPDVRPRRNRLHGFHVLWEVEQWDPTPPVDPALLRHIRGELWSVVATWDLTPLERAVLAARAR